MERVLTRLKENLDGAIRLLPPSKSKSLVTLEVFVLQGPDSPNGGIGNGLAYHSRGAALATDWVDPRWADSITVYCADNYLVLSDFWAQKSVLHEMAHAFHLRHWDEREPDGLLNAWRSAKTGGKYRNLQDVEGAGRVYNMAYALVDQREYFAELSVMYFYRCNYSPRNRQELREYDPEGFRVIQSMWGI